MICSDDAQADWWVSAGDETELAALLASIWNLDDVGSRFWGDEAQPLIDRMRGGH